jgi:membrane protease YdiL (CAAX protease family)
MLFYVKKSLWLDLTVTILLGSLGYLGMQHFSVPLRFSLSVRSCAQGFVTFLLIMSWTFLVQKSYAIAKGHEYAENLTDALAKEYLGTSFFHAVFGGLTAPLGEELFFRGFIQGQWGLIAGSVAFGLAHLGKKDIRIVSYWSYIHGLLFGLAYRFTENLAVPVIAHGLFDLGGVIYFQQRLRSKPS